MTTLADTLRQASRVNEAMRVVTAQLDRGLAARSVLVDSVGVHVIVTPAAEGRWARTFPHGHIVVGGAQVPLHVAVETDPAPCRVCRGEGQRIHGWAICPGPCEDCDGTGVAS